VTGRLEMLGSLDKQLCEWGERRPSLTWLALCKGIEQSGAAADG